MGRVQLQIMQILWRLGSATARQIAEQLNLVAPTAHSTVQTLLRKLERKGAVRHEVQDRAFVFHPLVQPWQVKQSATRELIERVFGGSAGGLVAYLLRNEKLTAAEMREIRQLINRAVVDRKATER